MKFGARFELTKPLSSNYELVAPDSWDRKPVEFKRFGKRHWKWRFVGETEWPHKHSGATKRQVRALALLASRRTVTKLNYLMNIKVAIDRYDYRSALWCFIMRHTVRRIQRYNRRHPRLKPL